MSALRTVPEASSCLTCARTDWRVFNAPATETPTVNEMTSEVEESDGIPNADRD